MVILVEILFRSLLSMYKATVLKKDHKVEFRSVNWIYMYMHKCTSACAHGLAPVLPESFLEILRIQ